MLLLLVEPVWWIFANIVQWIFDQYLSRQCNQKKQHGGKNGICASWYTYQLHAQIFSWFYLLKWSHAIKSHSVSNCTIWSHNSICFHLSVNPKNRIQENLNWQSTLDIYHVHHEYSSELIILLWAQNPWFDRKTGCFPVTWIHGSFQKSEEMENCRFARGIECTKHFHNPIKPDRVTAILLKTTISKKFNPCPKFRK